MTADFDLALSTVAHYRWGSLAVSFDRTRIRNRALVDAAGREQDLDYTVENTTEAAEVVAFLHELVHYAQDLTTGVGHWDDQLRRRWLPECLVNLRGPGSHPRPALPFAEDYDDDEQLTGDVSYTRTIHEAFIGDQQIFRRDKSFPAARAQAIADMVNRDLGTDHTPDQTLSLRPEALFEGEAAATVQSLMLKGKIDTSRRGALDDVANLWDFYRQPESYQASFRLFLSAFDALPEDPEWRAETAFDWFTTLIDLACAYPDPDWLARHPRVERTHFEPGVKFLRLTRAITGNARAIERVVDDAEAVERILLDAMPFRYPTARKVYAGWADWFDRKIRTESVGEPVLTVRRDSARRRADGNPILPTKTPMRMITAQLPLMMFDRQGPHQTWHGEMLADSERQSAVLADSLYDSTLAELVGAMVETGRFRCPLGLTGFCRSAQDRCRKITDLRQLPPLPGCHVRGMLEANEFRIATTDPATPGV
ncbi:hypothetical protein [Actinospica robiniae]|uniref:hypothetical protein n=1 Tax=Actinospica robiniae TaxID=304901 RepID=UPI000422A9BC|nr:hypothetical protein [Actinospica robiniae]